MDQLRALVEAADKDKVDLVNQLEEERRSVRPAESLIFLLIRWGEKATKFYKNSLFCSTGRWRTFSSVLRKLALPKEIWR